MKVAVIGGGAAGFFAAIQVKSNYPEATVILFEKSDKLLSKVRISGGGRCNVTNGTNSIKELVEAYPRGGKQLKKLFNVFNNKDCRIWFEERGVALKTEEDGRVFPVSNDSASIVECLMGEIKRLGVEILLKKTITAIKPHKDGIFLTANKKDAEFFNKVVVATGGSPKKSGLDWLEDLGHKIVHPRPSLFSFNMPDESIVSMSGLSVRAAKTSIEGLKHKAVGPLLITHWGMSGPAILKLSSYAARDLASMDYHYRLSVNWANEVNQEVVKSHILTSVAAHPDKQIGNIRLYELPTRLWEYLLSKSEIAASTPLSGLTKKNINKLTECLTNNLYSVKGKTTFKEEFVTCGGVSLDSVNMVSMESKIVPHLYFSGEVLDIDAITGGFNFQAAWTTAFVAGKLL